ncbi:MAG TPA: ATP-binding protein [Acidimicrobiales bacterium]|nr:ATP-binding protein [Acidimicrobiales bacterium]
MCLVPMAADEGPAGGVGDEPTVVAGGSAVGKTCDLSLPPEKSSARAARTSVEAFLGAKGGPESAIALVASELVTNAIVHARTAVRFTVELAPDCRSALVEVHDGRLPGPRPFPVGQPGSDTSRATHRISGRGLALVDSLSDEWGMKPEPNGKTMWAVVALDADPAHPERG